MKVKEYPPQTYLRECFDYNPDTGSLTWRARPREHFATDSAWKQWNSMRPGTSPPYLTHGYLGVNFSSGSHKGQYRQHRIIWVWVTGENPHDDIDHIDRDRTNNRWSNLRIASRAQNNHNGKLYRRNSSGYRGVAPIANSTRFTAQITMQRKKLHLGCFATPEEAHAAYCAAAAQIYPDINKDLA